MVKLQHCGVVNVALYWPTVA